MKKFWIIAIAILIGFMVWYYTRHPLEATVRIHGQRLLVELAITPKEKEKGLGYRDSLTPDHGMLFVYDHEEQFPFWMKGMRFPLDMIWIAGNTIVDITHDVPVATGTSLPIYHPKVAVDKILEVNAGTAARLGISEGEKVEFLK